MTEEIIPEVGMGATQYIGSDCHAYTIISIVSSRKVYVQCDKAVRIDTNGMSEQQEYAFEPDPHGTIWCLTKRKDGLWRVYNATVSGIYFTIGKRGEYHDYSF